MKKEEIDNYGEMRYMWRRVKESKYHGVGSNYDTAILCRVIIGLIKANAHTLYDIVYYNRQKFLSKVRKPHPRSLDDLRVCDSSEEAFLGRIEGFYSASIDLYNYFCLLREQKEEEI